MHEELFRPLRPGPEEDLVVNKPVSWYYPSQILNLALKLFDKAWDNVGVRLQEFEKLNLNDHTTWHNPKLEVSYPKQPVTRKNELFPTI